MENIKPLGKRVLVEQFTGGVTKGGLVLPDGATEGRIMTKGKVVAIGDVKKVKVGDVVYFKKFAVDELEFDGVKYSLLTEKELLATTNGNE